LGGFLESRIGETVALARPAKDSVATERITITAPISLEAALTAGAKPWSRYTQENLSQGDTQIGVK
jgi:hypothetical protein